MTCPTCGGEIPQGAETCPICGSSVPATVGGGSPSSAPPPGPATPAPHPSGLPSDVRNWAVGAHLSAFVGAWLALAFLGPLVVWLIRREVDGFSERHAREALNFNLTVLVVVAVGVALAVPATLVTLGLALLVLLPAALAIAVAWVVLPIIGAVRASEGRDYRYPLTIRFVS